MQQLGAHPEMASLVDSIMQQLLSKDVLYQPMKVLVRLCWMLWGQEAGQGRWDWVLGSLAGVNPGAEADVIAAHT